MIEVELPDGSIAEFPEGTSQEEITRAIKSFDAKPKERIAGGLLGLSGPVGKAQYLSQMLPNLPGSAKQFAADATFPIRHPIQTGQALYNLGSGAVSKLIPGEQESEKYIEGAGEFFKDRYGGLENVEDTMINDPVGMAADVSGLLALGAGALPKSGRLSQMARAVDPGTAAYNAARMAGGKIVPKGKPAELMESAVKWNTTTPEYQRRQMTETMLEEGIMPTSAGTAKASGLINELNSQIDSIINSATGSGQTVPTATLLKNVRRGMEEIDVPEQPEAARMLSAYQKQIDDQLKNWERMEVTEMTPAQVQAFKKNLYRQINFQNLNKTEQVVSEGQDMARRAMATGARESIESLDPRVAGINAREGQLLQLMSQLPRKAGRIENRDVLGLKVGTQGGAGAAIDYALGTPGVGTVLGIGGAIMDQPVPKARTALTLRGMQDATMTDAPLSPYIARQGLYNVGRQEEY